MEHAAKLFRELSQNKVRYLICGGLAVNVYGIPRTTADIDLLLDFEEKNILSFEKVVADQNYKPLLPISLNSLVDKSKREEIIRKKNLVAFSYYNAIANIMSVDVLIDVPLSFDEIWARKEIRNFGTDEIFFISLDDLISLKHYSNRVQDKQDIFFLSKIKNEKK